MILQDMVNMNVTRRADKEGRNQWTVEEKEQKEVSVV